MKNLIALMILLATISMIAGCDDGSTYYWNPASGKAHEGRCYEVSKGVDMIVNSALCEH